MMRHSGVGISGFGANFLTWACRSTGVHERSFIDSRETCSLALAVAVAVFSILADWESLIRIHGFIVPVYESRSRILSLAICLRS
jgi:hypothetical protein